MFTNQKILGIVLVVFIIGAISYFTIMKFKQDVSNNTASPSPTEQELDFTLNQPASLPAAQTPAELPLAKNKTLAQFPGILESGVLQNKKAVVQTNKGVIQLEIYPEASMTASNFMILAANGFYDGLTFHRVEDWVVQGGDPTGTGRGGPGYQFQDEPVTRPYVKGTVAMANAGPNTNGSQFFILKQDYPLQPDYTIFGIVVSGQDVVEKLSVGDIMQKVTIQNLR